MQDDALMAALRALNEAAYAALRAGDTRDAIERHPHLDRHALRRIARATDRLVDAAPHNRELVRAFPEDEDVSNG